MAWLTWVGAVAGPRKRSAPISLLPLPCPTNADLRRVAAADRPEHPSNVYKGSTSGYNGELLSIKSGTAVQWGIDGSGPPVGAVHVAPA